VVTACDPAAVADLVADHADTALALKPDVTGHREIAWSIGQTQARFGGVDVMVKNAGYRCRGAVEEASEAEIRQLSELYRAEMLVVSAEARVPSGFSTSLVSWIQTHSTQGVWRGLFVRHRGGQDQKDK
jgi:NADP-dependent 3-hydroxy acid dehydrogenase YdfG